MAKSALSCAIEGVEKRFDKIEERLGDVEYVTDNLKSNIGDIITAAGSSKPVTDALPTDSNGLIKVKEGQRFVTDDGQIYQLCPRADNGKLDFAFCGLLKKKKAA